MIPADKTGCPDLQALVVRHGGYNNIPPEAWAEFDRQTAEWQERRRTREGAPAEESADVERSAPEQLCICGLPGVVSRARKGGGRPIWRCEQHRNRWPDYGLDIEAQDDSYNAADDMWRSYRDCLAAVRERVAAGGTRWEPPR